MARHRNKAKRRTQKHHKYGQNTVNNNHNKNHEKFIRNVSSRQFTDSELQVLGKGLKFIPQTRSPTNIKQQAKQLKEMHRKMQCRFAYHTEEEHEIHPLYTNTNHFPFHTSCRIAAYASETLRDIRAQKLGPNKAKFNLSKKQRKALTTLKEAQEDTVIIKADKNSTIVIMDKDDYNKEGERQLNGVHYTKVNNPPCPIALQKRIQTIINHLAFTKQIDKTTIRYLEKTRKQKEWGNLYLLPKVHKLDKETIKKAQEEGLKATNSHIPGRPIIAQVKTPTYYIGKLVDILLLPYVQNLDTYIRDTPAFVRLIERTQLPHTAKIVTLDITSMYTNISHQELIQAVQDTLPEKVTHKGLSTTIERKEILRLLEIILDNNYFTFNGQTYKQTIGAAMGNTASPEICDLRLHKHMEKLLKESNLTPKIICNVRYRDDGFMIINATNDEIHNFFTMANQAHELLKLTYEISDTQATFLDTTVYKGPRFEQTKTLDIKTYTKPTETYQFLDRTSNHPEHVFKGFIKGRMITFIRNNSQPQDLIETVQNFRTKLKDRGYKPKEIQNGTNIATFPDRAELLADRPKDKTTPLVFVTPYNGQPNNLARILKQRWNINMTKNKRLRKLFPRPPMVCHKREKNLKEHIAPEKKKLQCQCNNCKQTRNETHKGQQRTNTTPVQPDRSHT